MGGKTKYGSLSGFVRKRLCGRPYACKHERNSKGCCIPEAESPFYGLERADFTLAPNTPGYSVLNDCEWRSPRKRAEYMTRLADSLDWWGLAAKHGRRSFAEDALTLVITIIAEHLARNGVMEPVQFLGNTPFDAASALPCNVRDSLLIPDPREFRTYDKTKRFEVLYSDGSAYFSIIGDAAISAQGMLKCNQRYELVEDIVDRLVGLSFGAVMRLELAEMNAMDRRRGWSTRRIVRRLLSKADAVGVTLHQHVADTGSVYLRVVHGYFGGTIRVSDHAQPVGGGFNEMRGERTGEADISVDPWGASVEDAERWLRELADSILEWQFACECEDLFKENKIPTA